MNGLRVRIAGRGAVRRGSAAAVWFGALALLVLCTVAAMPARSFRGVEPAVAVAVVEVGPQRSPAPAACTAGERVCGGRPSRAVGWIGPRLTSLDGGLPPVRAPTA